MTEITFVLSDGRSIQVDAEPGESVMQAALSNAVPGIVGECGGQLSCSTCHVFVDDGCWDEFEEPDEDEDGMLDATAVPRQANSRLSCQMTISESAACVHVPATQY